MPSLRQSIKRTSRTSSPFVRTANTSPAPAPATEPKKERTQGSLDSWIEPPLRSPVPSFQDYGMERTSLFQEMAPLGAMPPTRLKLRVKGDFRPDKSDSLPPSEAVLGTPEGSSPVETKSSKPASQEPMEIDAEPVVKEAEEEKVKEENDKAHAANGQIAVTPQVLSPIVQNGTPTPVQSRRTSTSKVTQASPKRAQDMASQTVRDPSRPERMEKVVKKALDLAASQGQPQIAATIARFYQETHNNPPLAAIFDAVVLKQETEEQKIQFREEMKRVKRALKRESSTRARTMSNSIPPEGYSGHPPTISTMNHPSIGFPTMSYQQSPVNQRSPYPPPGQQLQSPFSTFRANFHPFSPTTQSLPTSPSKPNVPSQQSPSIPAGPPRPSVTPVNLNAPPVSLPPPSASEQTVPMAVETRRSAARARADTDTSAPPSNAITQASNAAPSPPQAPVAAAKAPTTQGTHSRTSSTTPATNGSKKTRTEVAAAKAPSAKPGPKPGKSPKKNARARSKSVESVSSLSSVDDTIVQEGNPSAPNAAAAESAQQSRAVSRSATPRLGLNLKTKQKKGSNLKTGTKRGVSEVIPTEDIDEETVQRRRVAQANLDRGLKRRQQEEPPEPSYSSFRESEDYVKALRDNGGDSPYNHRRTLSRKAADGSASALRNSTSDRAAAAASTSTNNTGPTTRRTRESTQNQRHTIDLIGDAPRLEVTTPSTPGHPDSDGESNGGPPDLGEPPTKRRKTARTKFSPVKVPTYGVPPTRMRPTSPSRSSPFPDGGREGKKPNRDQCYSCGCGGNLICCDMCQNAFHAECWDPPCHDAGDEMFEGYEWICTHCRIWDKQQENRERANRGEPLLSDSEDELSDVEDEVKTPADFNLSDPTESYASKFIKQFKKGIDEWLPMQFSLQSVMRDAYDGYQVDVERRYKPVTKEPITVDSRMRPYEAVFDDGKQIKDPKDLKFCVKCGLTAISKKGDLIKCDTCSRYWHTDCLDPATTAPPQTWQATEKKGNRTVDVFKKRYWECPCHVDQDIVLFTDPAYYAGNPLATRGIRSRLPRRQISQAMSMRDRAKQLQPQKVREVPADAMHIHIDIDDTWWESFDKRMNEMKETGNTSFLVHENNILADFAAKARNNRIALAQTSDELIDALCPNEIQREGIKKQWHQREQAQIKAQVAAELAVEKAEIDSRVQKEVNAALTLQAMQNMNKGPSFNDLLADASDDSVVEKLVGTMTKEQIAKILELLGAVEKKIEQAPEIAFAQRTVELDGEMDGILARGRSESKSVERSSSPKRRASTERPKEEESEEERSSKRRKTEDEGVSSETTVESEGSTKDKPVEIED